MTQNKNPFQKKFADLAAKAILECAISLHFLQNSIFYKKILVIFPGKHGNSKK
jgi:hypothetical protein